jgi:hypothetical protein
MAGHKQKARQQAALDRLIVQYQQILDSSSPHLDRLAAEINTLKLRIGV